MARLPLPLKIGNHGTYGYVRHNESEGGCGVGNYPCTHWGIDVVGVPGMKVVSPVTGTVVYAVGAIPPFAGFDPYVIVIEDHEPVEHRYHLIGHLDYQVRDAFGDNHAGKWPTLIRKPVRAGQVIGAVGGYRHIHWQVQSQPYQRDGKRWADITRNPVEWASERGAVYAPPGLVTDDYIGPMAAFMAALIATKG